jgi:serine/threonine-protein kinase RsbW
MRTRVESGERAVDVEFCLVFPREALSVPVMRHVLGETLSKLGVDESSISDLLLAVTEACTNVIRHSGPGRRYEIVAHVGSKRCLLEVLDTGRGFDLPSVARRSAIRRPVGPVARLRRHPSPTGPSPVSALRSRLRRSGRLSASRAIADLPESGRGLAIMQACVDDVTLTTGPGQGTVVSLQKRIEWRSDAPLQLLPAAQLRDVG